MSILQDRIYAKKWFELAINKNKLTKNGKKLSKKNGSEELRDLIEFYDRLLCEQYNMISVF